MLDAIEKAGRNQNSLNCHLDTLFRAPAGRAGKLGEAHQGLDFALANFAAVGPAREIPDDPADALWSLFGITR